MMDREKIAKIIQALLAKTTENGATEAEAMAAAEKARTLMDRYQIEEGVLGMEEEGAFKAAVKRDRYKTLILKDRIATAVAEFCDCKVWMQRSVGDIYFFGLRPDAEFAAWLIESLQQFIANSARDYLAGQSLTGKSRWQAEKAFVLGACSRINERLQELIASRKRTQMGDGRSLVVVKNAIVEREYAKLGLKLRKGSAYRISLTNKAAHDAGRAAGDRASFGRPVNNGNGVALIGRGIK